MKKATVLLALGFVMFVLAPDVRAQYTTGIGIRYGLSKGATFVQFINPQSRGAADILVNRINNAWNLVALYEIHSKNHSENIEVANVGFFLGGGLHVSWRNALSNRLFYPGLSAIAGIEWKLPHVPLNLSLDCRPYIDLPFNKDQYGDQQTYDFDYALALKFLF